MKIMQKSFLNYIVSLSISGAIFKEFQDLCFYHSHFIFQQNIRLFGIDLLWLLFVTLCLVAIKNKKNHLHIFIGNNQVDSHAHIFFHAFAMNLKKYSFSCVSF